MNWLIRGEPARGINVTILRSDGDDDNGNAASSSITSTIVVRGLTSTHSGEWACVLSDEVRNSDGSTDTEIRQKESTSVLVITSDTPVCPPRTTKTSRGSYTWGSAIGGHTVQQPCKKLKEGAHYGFAFALCRESGERAQGVNVTHCGYTSNVREF